MFQDQGIGILASILPYCAAWAVAACRSFERRATALIRVEWAQPRGLSAVMASCLKRGYAPRTPGPAVDITASRCRYAEWLRKHGVGR